MTDNTLTPAELIADAEWYVERNPDSDVAGVLASALHAALTKAAERDALAAVVAEANTAAEYLAMHIPSLPLDAQRDMSALLSALSKLPADAPAARDARVLREAASRSSKPGVENPAPYQVWAWCSEWLRAEADRIEREAQ